MPRAERSSGWPPATHSPPPCSSSPRDGSANVAGLGWRSVFLINVPIGFAALALAPRVVAESRVPGARKIDLTGTALVTAGLTAILLPLVEGRQHGWPVWTWISLAIAPVII